MSLIAVAILFTCCFFAPLCGAVECGRGTSCEYLSDCPEYLQPYTDLRTNGRRDEIESYLRKRITPVTCDYDIKKPKVCCKEPRRCGKLRLNRRKGPDGELDQFPWVALLTYQTANGRKFGCGGVLISDRHVLTAAQCLNSGNELVSVRLGEYDLQTAEDCIINPHLPYCTAEAIDFGIEKQIPHENYSSLRGPADFDPSAYDIAVLKLDRSAITDVIQPVCLPEPLLEVNEQASTSYMDGWGLSIDRTYPKSTMKLMFNLKKTACKRSYGSTLKNDHICALSEAPSRSCNADVGGALMGFNKLSKISVSGIYSPEARQSCRIPDVPSTFIDVRKHLDWIQVQMQH